MGELVGDRDEEARYKRHIALKRVQEDDASAAEDIYYLIDTDELNLTIYTKDAILSKLNSGVFILENKDHTLTERIEEDL